MSKKDEFLNIAESLYTKERYTIEEIAKKIPVSERTLRYWAEQNGWKSNKKEYMEKTKKYHQNILDTVVLLGESIKTDIENGEEPSTSRISAFKSLVFVLEKMKKYEDSVQVETKESQQVDINELFKKVMNEGLGL